MMGSYLWRICMTMNGNKLNANKIQVDFNCATTMTDKNGCWAWTDINIDSSVGFNKLGLAWVSLARFDLKGFTASVLNFLVSDRNIDTSVVGLNKNETSLLWGDRFQRFETLLRYKKFLRFKTFLRFKALLHFLTKIWLRYGWIMDEMWLRYNWDMAKMWIKYG